MESQGVCLCVCVCVCGGGGGICPSFIPGLPLLQNVNCDYFGGNEVELSHFIANMFV